MKRKNIFSLFSITISKITGQVFHRRDFVHSSGRICFSILVKRGLTRLIFISSSSKSFYSSLWRTYFWRMCNNRSWWLNIGGICWSRGRRHCWIYCNDRNISGRRLGYSTTRPSVRAKLLLVLVLVGLPHIGHFCGDILGWKGCLRCVWYQIIFRGIHHSPGFLIPHCIRFEVYRLTG